MRVISLYSFKGGVGRTSLALNLAYELAQQSKFVVLADWDLHAPGLSLMNDLAMPSGPFPRKGILDFLWSALSPLDASDQATADVIDPLLLAQPTVLAERSRINKRSFGDILFVPAGLFGSENQNTYPESLRKLHLPDLVTWRARLLGSESEQSVLRFFCNRIGTARSEAFGKDYPPDFILLDSRTGITEIGDVLLGNGVDHYIVLFGLNEQNQAGMEMIVRGAQERVRVGGLPDVLTLIASPVPVGEEDLLQERLTALSARLGRLARPLEDTGKPEPLPSVLRIPYHPRLALREEIMLEKYPDSTLAQVYRDIAAHILQQERTLESTEINTKAQILADVPSASEIIESARDTDARRPEAVPRKAVKAPRPYVDPPPWNWPKNNLKQDQLIPGVSHELSQPLLDGLAWSGSLHWLEKLRVLAFAVSLPAPRIAGLTEPLVEERERRVAVWDHDWRAVEETYARAATDWVMVLDRLRHVDGDKLWASIGTDSTSELLPEVFASPRLLYLVARELVRRESPRAAIPLFIRALSSPALMPVSARAADLRLRLQSLDLATLDGEEFQQLFPVDTMDAFQSILDLHVLEPASIVKAMAVARQMDWTSEASALGKQIATPEVSEAPLWSAIANEYRLLGDFISAEHAARQAIDQNPTLVSGWLLLAIALMRNSDRAEEAREALYRAEQLATDPAELRLVAATYSDDFLECERGLQLYEKGIGSEPDLLSEIELAEIAIGAQAPDIARKALVRASILLQGPLSPGLGLKTSQDRRLISVFHVVEIALALLDKNREKIIAASKSLIDAVKVQTAKGWRFNAMISGLRHLPENALGLLKSATTVARDGDSATFQVALEVWERTAQ